MQKKIIVLAIAAAMSVPALAMAEVAISGQANFSINMVNNGATVSSVSANQLRSDQSRLILKGTEDLGGGLSAMFQLDSRFNMDTGLTSANSLFTGNTFLGLKSNDMGTVLVGRYDTPYKSSTRRLDVFFDTVADNRSGNRSGDSAANGLMSVHDARLDNVLAYVSPSMSGMSVAAATVFGAETPATSAAKKGSALSFAGMYEQGPIFATLAYQTITAGTSGSGTMGAAQLNTAFGTALAVDDKASAMKLGGGYTMDALTVNAVVERTTYDPIAAGSNVTNTNLYLAGKFGISSTDAVKAAYTKHGKSSTVGSTDDASQIAIGYDHNMSKATSVYAVYVKTTNNTVVAANPSTLSFGMKHAF